jgi:hypothetical protein
MSILVYLLFMPAPNSVGICSTLTSTGRRAGRYVAGRNYRKDDGRDRRRVLLRSRLSVDMGHQPLAGDHGSHRDLAVTWRTWSLPINNEGRELPAPLPAESRQRILVGVIFSLGALRAGQGQIGRQCCVVRMPAGSAVAGLCCI